MKRIIILIIIINKYINCIFSEEEGLKLYANEICSYHGTPIINGNNVTCICEYFYSKIDDLNQTQILNNIIQCYYHKKHKFIVLFFSIFLPFGLDYLYLERYLEFTLILLSYIFVIINQLICFFISNKFKGENIQEIQPKEKIDNKKIIEEEKEETNDDFFEFDEMEDFNENTDNNNCHQLYKSINFILSLFLFFFWIINIIFQALGKIKDGNGVDTADDLYYLLRTK